MKHFIKTFPVVVVLSLATQVPRAQSTSNCAEAKLQSDLGEKNKALVAAFWHDVFAMKNAEAARKYLVPDYIQHTKHIPTGLEGFVGYFHPAYVKEPEGYAADLAEGQKEYYSDIVESYAAGDIVVIHVHDHGSYDHGKNAGKMIELRYMDIFRCKDGKIIEHWGALD